MRSLTLPLRCTASNELPKAKKAEASQPQDDGPVRTQESADAMMALLLAEDARERAKKTVGIERAGRGKKRLGKKKKR